MDLSILREMHILPEKYGPLQNTFWVDLFQWKHRLVFWKKTDPAPARCYDAMDNFTQSGILAWPMQPKGQVGGHAMYFEPRWSASGPVCMTIPSLDDLEGCLLEPQSWL
jgi:hypothetical protein